ncbi:MAG: DUF3783 domain-containing protein [Oscillospiraceae bacterium]|nr:DUF3783 domain-containing protein [Oscillospiraceae bacterium]
MAQALLFNIKDTKLEKIRFLLMKLGISCREIPPEDFVLPLGILTGRGLVSGTGDDCGPFTGEMLVMDGFDSRQLQKLLDGLRREGAAVALKAVVTEQNLRWSAARLYTELSAEHEAMSRAPGKSVHKG